MLPEHEKESKQNRTLPRGMETLGPIIIPSAMKEKFSEVCRKEEKTMAIKLKEIIVDYIKKVFPTCNTEDMI